MLASFGADGLIFFSLFSVVGLSTLVAPGPAVAGFLPSGPEGVTFGSVMGGLPGSKSAKRAIRDAWAKSKGALRAVKLPSAER